MTLRALIVAVLLIPINSYWIMQTEAVRFVPYPTTVSLYSNVVFIISILAAVNLILKRYFRRFALGTRELLILYTILCISSCIAAHAMTQNLISTMGHAFWFATPENDWENLFWRHIPDWLSVSDKSVLKPYYEGDSTFYALKYINAWAGPMLAWGGFIFALLFAMLCINIILRKQWVERERLKYPIIQLPYEMAGGMTNFFKNKVMWIGFAIVAVVDLINGLHTLFPSVPYLHVKLYEVGHYFVEKPWNAIGWTPVGFFPFAIGMAFFIPLDLSFSLWFFYLFWKVQMIFFSFVGYKGAGAGYYQAIILEQTSGGFLGLGLVALWMSRRQISSVFKKVINLRSEHLDDSAEPFKYRTAVLGLICALVFILIFFYSAGMSIWAIVLFFSMYLLLAVSITRMRAEVGPIVHDLPGGPDYLIPQILGTRMLGPNNLTMYSFFWFLNRARYSDPMPHQLEGFKLAERAYMSSRTMMLGIIFATVVGILSAAWALLHISYKTGMENSVVWLGREAFGRLQGWINNPTHASLSDAGFLTSGVLAVVFLTAMRTRFVWWLFHPVGYALSASWGISCTWFPIFLSWLAKWSILRFGGLKLHRRAVPFFTGLILGDFTMGSIWSIIGIVFKVPTYAIWWY